MLNRIPTYFLLLVSAVSLGVAILRAPVMQGAPLVEGIGAAEAASVMFDRADYALARSWREVRAGDGPAAANWARESVSRAPRSAYAMLALAWGEALSGEDAKSRAALTRTYELAPRSTPLAVSRASLAQRWWPIMDEDERERLLEEVRIARGLDAHAFNLLAEDVPRLKTLYELSEALR